MHLNFKCLFVVTQILQLFQIFGYFYYSVLVCLQRRRKVGNVPSEMTQESISFECLSCLRAWFI